MNRHRRQSWYHRRLPPPREPFYKDEHITRRITTGRAVRLFVLAVILAVVALTIAALFLAHEITASRQEREAAHADRLKVEQQLRMKIQNGLAQLRAEDAEQFRQAICAFVLQYKRKDSHPLDVLRERYHCKKPGPSTGASSSGGTRDTNPSGGSPGAQPASGAPPPEADGPGLSSSPHSSRSSTPIPHPGAPGGTRTSNPPGAPRPPPTSTPPRRPTPTPTPTRTPVVDVGDALCLLLGICLG